MLFFSVMNEGASLYFPDNALHFLGLEGAEVRCAVLRWAVLQGRRMSRVGCWQLSSTPAGLNYSQAGSAIRPAPAVTQHTQPLPRSLAGCYAGR